MAMRVTCTQCGAAYKIDETKIPASGGAVRCQACGTRFAVMPPPADAAPEVPQTLESMADEATMPMRSGVSAPASETHAESEGTNPSIKAPVSPSIALPSFGEEANPSIKAPVSSAIALPSFGEGTNPSIKAPISPSIALPSFGEGTNPSIKAPVSPAIALPSFEDVTNAGFRMPEKGPPSSPALALPSFGEGPNPSIKEPASPPIALPAFEDVTNAGFRMPEKEPPSSPALALPSFSESMQPTLKTPAIALPSFDALPSPQAHAEAPFGDEEGDTFDNEKTAVSRPRPEVEDAREEVFEADEFIDDDAIVEEQTERASTPSAFDDLPAPASSTFAPPDDLPTPDDESPQFAGITLSNKPIEAPPRPPDDLPAPLDEGGAAPLSLGPVTFAPTTMDDLPTPASARTAEEEAALSDLPSPLDAPGMENDDALPEPVMPSEFAAQLPPPPEDDLPTPLGADLNAVARTPRTNPLLDEETDVGEDASRERARGRVRSRVLLITGAFTLVVLGGALTAFLVTGEAPWAMFRSPPPAASAQRPVAPQAPATSVPPAPDFTAIEGHDLDAYAKAIAVLDERKAARKAAGEAEEAREDQALRARVIWQGAVLLGSRWFSEELKKRPPAKEGELHPHEERAEAARAFMSGDQKGMAERLAKLLARDKGDKDAHLLYGYALLKTEDTVNAGKHFDEVLRIDDVDRSGKKSIDALLGQAEIARRTGDLDSAASFVEKAEESSQSSMRVRLARAEIDQESGAHDAAEKAVKELIRTAENLGERDRARLRFLRATHAAAAGNLRIAKSELDAAWLDEASARIGRAIVWSRLARGDIQGLDKSIEAARALDDGTYAESFFLAEASRLIAAQDFAKAKEFITAAAKSGVEKRSVLYADGLLNEAQKRLAQALKAYTASAKADKQLSLPVLADIRLRKQPQKVKLARLALAAKTFADARALAAHGDALFDAGAFAPAAERYRAALDKDPWVLDLPKISERLAEAYSRSGNKRAGAKLVIENAEVDPKNTEAIEKLVELAKTAQAYDEAQRLIDAGLDEQPKSTRLLLLLAEIQILRENRDKARATLQQLLKTEDKNPRVQELLALSYHPKDPDLVKLHIKNALELSPTEPRYHALLGESYFSKDKYDEARDAFERALELDPQNAETVLMLARIADLQGRKKEAIDRYKKALELAPERKQIVPELAERMEEAGQTQEALELLLARAKRDPQNGQLALSIGRIYQASGNRALAIKFFKQALKLDASDPSAYYRLGYLYKDAGNAKEARKAFETYLKLNPKADDRKDIEAEIAELR